MLDRVGLIIVAVNLILGLSCAFPLARRFAMLGHYRWGIRGSYLMLVLVYFVESVGFAAGMVTNVPGVALAFVWGILLGYRLRRSGGDLKAVMWTAVSLSVYTSLPAVSMLAVPLAMRSKGWAVLSAESGGRFGIPEFLPWPMNTILGFFVLVAVIAIVSKGMVTTGVVYRMNRPYGKVGSPFAGERRRRIP